MTQRFSPYSTYNLITISRQYDHTRNLHKRNPLIWDRKAHGNQVTGKTEEGGAGAVLIWIVKKIVHTWEQEGVFVVLYPAPRKRTAD